MNAEIIIPVTLFISSAVTIIMLRKFLNEERLAAIEKDANLDQFKFKMNFGNIALKFGLLLMGVGCGILLAGLLESFFKEEAAAYFSMIFIFGGLGLFISHKIEKKEASRK